MGNQTHYAEKPRKRQWRELAAFFYCRKQWGIARFFLVFLLLPFVLIELLSKLWTAQRCLSRPGAAI